MTADELIARAAHMGDVSKLPVPTTAVDFIAELERLDGCKYWFDADAGAIVARSKA